MYLNYSYHGKLLINNQKYLLPKRNLLIKFLDDNHTTSQILDIKIPKSGVFRLNTIGLINVLDVDMSTSNISTYNYT